MRISHARPPLLGMLVLVCGVDTLAGARELGARRLPPRDEAVRDPSLVRFRGELLAILDRRDVRALEAVTDPRVRTGFGKDDVGVAGLRRDYGLDRPEQSALWGTLRRVLLLGGTFQSRSRFCAPYVYTTFPDDLDAFEHVVVLGAATRLRARPDQGASDVAVLEHEIVRRVDETDAEAPGWVQVRLHDGRQGYVRADEVRSPIDHRACFDRTRRGWRLGLLVAGD